MERSEKNREGVGQVPECRVWACGGLGTGSGSRRLRANVNSWQSGNSQCSAPINVTRTRVSPPRGGGGSSGSADCPFLGPDQNGTVSPLHGPLLARSTGTSPPHTQRTPRTYRTPRTCIPLPFHFSCVCPAAPCARLRIRNPASSAPHLHPSTSPLTPTLHPTLHPIPTPLPAPPSPGTPRAPRARAAAACRQCCCTAWRRCWRGCGTWASTWRSLSTAGAWSTTTRTGAEREDRRRGRRGRGGGGGGGGGGGEGVNVEPIP